MRSKKSIKVRLAPSPTGKLHIGTARTGLFNFLFARHKGGKYFIRIEDTDLKRSDKKYEKEILEGLKWLGLDWDGQPVRQSVRMKEGIYKEHLEQLISKGYAYPCYCTKDELSQERQRQRSRGIPPKYSGKCLNLEEEEIAKLEKKGLKPTYRLNVVKVAEESGLSKELKFNDLIRGEISFGVAIIGDFILAKEDGSPLYQFAVVVDDHDMEVSHVIRGEDHISNTFNQLLLYKAFGFEPPKFAHLPLILDPDRSKLSKRKGNVVSIEDFRKLGYLPQALVNYMALLGWGIKGKDDEIFSLKEAIENFNLKDVSSSGAIFETDKLDYINGYYIRQLSDQELIDILVKEDFIEEQKRADKEKLEKIVGLVKDRLKKLSDFDQLTKYFFQEPEYSSDLLIFGKSNQKNTIKGLQVAIESISMADEKVLSDADKINDLLAKEVSDAGLGNGDLFWPVRVALSGREASPSPSELIMALGKEETIDRLSKALSKLE
jgi:glutamyl-tRNA synthetase